MYLMIVLDFQVLFSLQFVLAYLEFSQFFSFLVIVFFFMAQGWMQCFCSIVFAEGINFNK